MKIDFMSLSRVQKKLEMTCMSGENLIARTKVALEMSDIFSIYNSFKIEIPKLMKVAMFLVF